MTPLTPQTPRTDQPPLRPSPRCPDSGTLQDFLESLLPGPQMESLRMHLADCPHCAAERARFERLFDAFDSLTLEAPAPALATRVLDSVLPARRQTRWVRRFGVGYAAALVASLGAGVAVASHPAGRSFMAWLASEAPARVLDLLRFGVNVASFLALRLASGWGLISSAGSRISPLLRALLVSLDQPAIQISLALSVVACLAVVWWLHSRTDRSNRGMPHVGLLGF